MKGALAHAAHGLILAPALSAAKVAWDSCQKYKKTMKVSTIRTVNYWTNNNELLCYTVNTYNDLVFRLGSVV